MNTQWFLLRSARELEKQKHLITLTGLLESSSKGTAKELVASICPLDTLPSKTPTTRFFVPRATR